MNLLLSDTEKCSILQQIQKVPLKCWLGNVHYVRFRSQRNKVKHVKWWREHRKGCPSHIQSKDLMKCLIQHTEIISVRTLLMCHKAAFNDSLLWHPGKTLISMLICAVWSGFLSLVSYGSQEPKASSIGQWRLIRYIQIHTLISLCSKPIIL